MTPWIFPPPWKAGVFHALTDTRKVQVCSPPIVWKDPHHFLCVLTNLLISVNQTSEKWNLVDFYLHSFNIERGGVVLLLSDLLIG